MDSDTLGAISSVLSTVVPIVLFGGVAGAVVALLLHRRGLALGFLVFALMVMIADQAVGALWVLSLPPT